jgi:hypothetical protein
VVGVDTVTVGGTTSQGQVIELANQISSGFDNDGIMGLAFSTINTGMSSVICIELEPALRQH